MNLVAEWPASVFFIILLTTITLQEAVFLQPVKILLLDRIISTGQ